MHVQYTVTSVCILHSNGAGTVTVIAHAQYTVIVNVQYTVIVHVQCTVIVRASTQW